MKGVCGGGVRPGAAAAAGRGQIGTRPTVAGVRQQLEVHLLDVTMDLYGRHIEVVLRAKLRNEQQFASLDALKQQIANDVVTARKFFGLQTPVLISIAEKRNRESNGDYKNTLNCRKQGSRCAAISPKREPGMLQRWYEQNLYGIHYCQKGKTFILHDGPPYTNGSIH